MSKTMVVSLTNQFSDSNRVKNVIGEWTNKTKNESSCTIIPLGQKR
jgi:hypothetical protein